LIECISPARTAGDAEVLARHVHQPATNCRRAGHDAVGRQQLALHAEQRGTVAGELTHFVKAAGVRELLDAFARRQLA
jgi:hypothetical protein